MNQKYYNYFLSFFKNSNTTSHGKWVNATMFEAVEAKLSLQRGERENTKPYTKTWSDD